jgi:hypothetical protein
MDFGGGLVKKSLARNVVGSQSLLGEECLRSQRVMVRVPVTLLTMVAGEKVTLRGFTVSVNDHRAMLQCSRTIAAGTKVEMQNDRTGQKQLGRVTRTPLENQQSYLIPVEFASPTPGFWHISFPPTDWKPFDD